LLIFHPKTRHFIEYFKIFKYIGVEMSNHKKDKRPNLDPYNLNID